MSGHWRKKKQGVSCSLLMRFALLIMSYSIGLNVSAWSLFTLFLNTWTGTFPLGLFSFFWKDLIRSYIVMYGWHTIATPVKHNVLNRECKRARTQGIKWRTRYNKSITHHIVIQPQQINYYIFLNIYSASLHICIALLFLFLNLLWKNGWIVHPVWPLNLVS